MAAFRTVRKIAVSEALFRLMTEGVRLHSNEIMALSSLAELVEARRRTFLLSLCRHELATLREHFAAVPSQGKIAVESRVSGAGADCLAKAATWLTVELGFEASVADAVSALLLDYAVERAAARMLESLGVGANPVEDGASAGREGPTKVFPMR